MSVKLTTHQTGEVIVVVVSGKLTMGEGASTLRTKIRELVASGSRRIVLNMADVTYMDSSGIGELVAAYTTVTTAGGELKLLNLAKRVHELLNITKLYTIFETFEDEASAVISFAVTKPIELQAHV
jgi:anti-sigma B factor antagonist